MSKTTRRRLCLKWIVAARHSAREARKYWLAPLMFTPQYIVKQFTAGTP